MASSPLPSSYATLPFQHIQTSHVPASSPSPTPTILITLYRPQNHNAFTDTMTTELESLFNLLSLDPRVKSIVVTGHGRIFCAGADLSSPASDGKTGLSYTHETPLTHRDGGGRVTLAIHRCTKPVIAAINGSAVGVGITMTLPMSIRIISQKAKVGFVFARRGIVMEAASSYFLPKLIGLSRSMHLITTGSVYLSTSPLFGDLFSEILPEEQVLPRALEIAQDIAKNTSSVSTNLMKEMMWRNPGTAEGTHLLDSRLLFEIFEGKDKKEGVDSFLEKRDPDFKGNMVENAPSAYPWWEPVETRAPGAVGEAVAKVGVKAKL